MPPAPQPKPSTYQLSLWEKKYGTALEDALKGRRPAIRLIDAHWLVCLAMDGGMLGHRQSLPEEAFVGLDTLKMMGAPTGMLPVIAISYTWLHPSHPDPKAFHLLTLGKALRILTSVPAEQSASVHGPSKTQRYGVFLDFCSMYQHPDPTNNLHRTEEEEAAFVSGLNSLNLFYAAAGTIVLRLTGLPEGYPQSYDVPPDSNGAHCTPRPDEGGCGCPSGTQRRALLRPLRDHSLRRAASQTWIAAGASQSRGWRH